MAKIRDGMLIRNRPADLVVEAVRDWDILCVSFGNSAKSWPNRGILMAGVTEAACNCVAHGGDARRRDRVEACLSATVIVSAGNRVRQKGRARFWHIFRPTRLFAGIYSGEFGQMVRNIEEYPASCRP